MNIVELPAELVKSGDVIWYANKEFPIVSVVRLKDCTTLNYLLDKDRSGYFNFEHDRIIKIVDKRNEFNIPADSYVAQPMPELGHAIKPSSEVLDGCIMHLPGAEIKTYPLFTPVEENMETLNIQNAIEAQRILLQKLEQMLDLTQLAPSEDGKIAVGNTSIRVDKASIVKAARDEMKVAQSKVTELIKKL